MLTTSGPPHDVAAPRCRPPRPKERGATLLSLGHLGGTSSRAMLEALAGARRKEVDAVDEEHLQLHANAATSQIGAIVELQGNFDETVLDDEYGPFEGKARRRRDADCVTKRRCEEAAEWYVAAGQDRDGLANLARLFYTGLGGVRQDEKGNFVVEEADVAPGALLEYRFEDHEGVLRSTDERQGWRELTLLRPAASTEKRLHRRNGTEIPLSVTWLAQGEAEILVALFPDERGSRWQIRGSGRDAELDTEIALELWQHCAEEGCAKSCVNAAVILAARASEEHEIQEVERLLLRGVALGHPLASMNLAALRSVGLGKALSRNDGACVHHLREANEGGVGAAALALGDAHLAGQGCDKSDRRAFLLYRRAAMLGEAQSLKRLADCHARGTGIDLDPTKAQLLLRNATSANLLKIEEQTPVPGDTTIDDKLKALGLVAHDFSPEKNDSDSDSDDSDA